MKKIIAYLTEKYHPSGIVVYGSYASGTNNLGSDFDALLIYDGAEQLHDHSIVDAVELDVYVYPQSAFAGEYDIDSFLQIWDGQILTDRTGVLHALQAEANEYIRSHSRVRSAEREKSLAWCEKMLKRTERGDMEGLYRLHWLLVDSLQIYCDLRSQYFFGPKKALQRMTQTDPVSAELYLSALKDPTRENLSAWIDHLKSCKPFAPGEFPGKYTPSPLPQAFDAPMPEKE